MKRIIRHALLTVALVVVLCAIAFRVFVSPKAARYLSSYMQKEYGAVVDIGRVRTNIFSEIHLENLRFDLSRYSVFASLDIERLTSHINLLAYLWGRGPLGLKRIVATSPQLTLRNGDLTFGLSRLFDDLKESEFQHRVEIHHAGLVYRGPSGREYPLFQNLWGYWQPREQDMYELSFTNRMSREQKDVVHLTGQFDFKRNHQAWQITLENYNINQVLYPQLSKHVKPFYVSVEMTVEGDDAHQDISISSVQVHGMRISGSGQGRVSKEDGQRQMDVQIRYQCRGYDGHLRIDGDLFQPRLHVEQSLQPKGVNISRAFIDAELAFKETLVIKSFKLESNYSYVELQGNVDHNMISVYFQFRENYFADLNVKGNLVCEWDPADQKTGRHVPTANMYLSKLQLNQINLDNIRATLSLDQRTLRIHEMKGGASLLTGELSFETAEPEVTVSYSCQDGDLAKAKPLIMRDRSHANLSGMITGDLSVEGPWNQLTGYGSFVVHDGSIGMIPSFKKMIFDFQLNAPLLTLKDARILRENDYFVLSNTMDLSRHDGFDSVTVEHKGKSMEWESMTIHPAGPEIGLNIFGDENHLSASGGEENAKENTLLDVEIDLDQEGQELFFKIEEDEGFMGVGKKFEF